MKITFSYACVCVVPETLAAAREVVLNLPCVFGLQASRSAGAVLDVATAAPFLFALPVDPVSFQALLVDQECTLASATDVSLKLGDLSFSFNGRLVVSSIPIFVIPPFLYNV